MKIHLQSHSKWSLQSRKNSKGIANLKWSRQGQSMKLSYIYYSKSLSPLIIVYDHYNNLWTKGACNVHTSHQNEIQFSLELLTTWMSLDFFVITLRNFSFLNKNTYFLYKHIILNIKSPTLISYILKYTIILVFHIIHTFCNFCF